MRLIYIYGFEGIVFILFLVWGIKIRRRGKGQLNTIFSCFYLFSSLGILMNFIYVPISMESGLEQIVLILNYSAIFFIAYSLSFLVVSQIIILKSTVVFNTKKQLGLFIFFLILNASLYLFINLDGVVFSEETDWIAAFSPSFYIYLLSIMSLGGVIPTLYLSFRIRKTFEKPELKKKWDYFIIGLILIIFFMYSTYTINFLNRTEFRSTLMNYSGIFGVLLIGFVISGAAFIYYGIGKQLKT